MTFLWAAFAVSKTIDWLHRLGGLGLILLGLVDQSAIPVPGSMDALTIVLAASKKEYWWYYAIMATAGAMAGGYITYRLARKGGKATLEKKLPKGRAQQIYKMFERYGFASLFVGSILPPPVPIVPFLASAGAMQYPRHKFFLAVGSGRLLRYGVVAYLGAHYGHQMFHWFGRYYKPVLIGLIAAAVVGSLVGLWYYKTHKRQVKRAIEGKPTHKAA